jgi:hypothetical protein
MRYLLLFSLLSAACGGSHGSQPDAKTAADEKAGFAETTRDRWQREEEQRGVERRRNAFTSNSAQRGEVQPEW